MSGRRLLSVLAIASVAAALLLLSVSRGQRSTAKTSSGVANKPAQPGYRSNAVAPRAQTAPLDHRGQAPTKLGRLRVADTQGRSARDVYLENSKFPPTSRPHSEATQDLLDWNRRHEKARPIVDEATRKPTGVEVLFTADKAAVVGEESVSVILEVSGAGDLGDSGIAVIETSASVPGGELLALDFAFNGTRGIATFIPATLVAKRGGANSAVVTVRARLAIGGEEHRFSVRIQATQSAPAAFTGQVRSTSEAKGLVVAVELSVSEPGFYVLEANLWDANNTPLVWSRFRGELDAGMTTAELVFAGNAILSKSPSMPLEIRELRGLRVTPRAVPDTEYLQAFNDPIAVEVNVNVLSPADWDSPEKRAKLRALDRFDIP